MNRQGHFLAFIGSIYIVRSRAERKTGTTIDGCQAVALKVVKYHIF